jgi:hypothetical protein
MLGVAVCTGTSGGAVVALADSFTPVHLGITIANTARLNKPLRVTVAISADSGALDTATGPLSIGVKLSPECGGSYATTTGTVLLNRRLSPQPATGKAYAATATGSGIPRSYGVMTVCTYLTEPGDARQFATSQAFGVDVSHRCTAAAARYDKALRSLRVARRRNRGTTRAAALAATRYRAAFGQCGPGVPL